MFLKALIIIFIDIIIAFFTYIVINYKGDLQYVAYIVNFIIICIGIYYNIDAIGKYIDRIDEYIYNKRKLN